jgi:hypothetical protein
LNAAADLAVNYNISAQIADDSGALVLAYVEPNLLVKLVGIAAYDVYCIVAEVKSTATIMDDSIEFNYGNNFHTEKSCGSIDLNTNSIKGNLRLPKIINGEKWKLC